jgi:hypothetical protein
MQTAFENSAWYDPLRLRDDPVSRRYVLSRMGLDLQINGSSFRRPAPTRWRACAALFSVLSLVLSTPTLAAPVLGDGWLPGPWGTWRKHLFRRNRRTSCRCPSYDVGRGPDGRLVRRSDGHWLGRGGRPRNLSGNDGQWRHAADARLLRPRATGCGCYVRSADWTASGWSAIAPTTALVPGNNVLSVYAHSPAKGWWYRQVVLNVNAGATNRVAPPALGFDISFPQCGGPEPNAPAFALVGVNGGRAFTGNPCLARQYVWALTATSVVQPRAGFYMNTGKPWPGSFDQLAEDWDEHASAVRWFLERGLCIRLRMVGG